MELNEIVKIISNINDELLIYDFAIATVGTDGEITYVEFMYQPIWDSENDTREYIGEEKESLDIFIRKEINKFLDSIRNARLEIPDD